jgi:anti-sigma B factor antagonist
MPPIVIVEAPTRLDAYASAEFGSFVVSVINAGATRIIINLSLVGYLGSAGVGSLLLIAKSLTARNGRLALLAARPSVIEVLRICGLAEQFVLVDTIDDARERV